MIRAFKGNPSYIAPLTHLQKQTQPIKIPSLKLSHQHLSTSENEKKYFKFKKPSSTCTSVTQPKSKSQSNPKQNFKKSRRKSECPQRKSSVSKSESRNREGERRKSGARTRQDSRRRASSRRRFSSKTPMVDITNLKEREKFIESCYQPINFEKLQCRQHGVNNTE